MSVRRTKIALIAHDGRKADMVAFATYNRDRLAEFDLVATATTGDLLTEKVGLRCQKVLSGPHGGDAQIAALVAEGLVKAVIFLVDPLTSPPPTTPTSRRCCASATSTTCPLLPTWRQPTCS